MYRDGAKIRVDQGCSPRKCQDNGPERETGGEVRQVEENYSWKEGPNV